MPKSRRGHRFFLFVAAVIAAVVVLGFNVGFQTNPGASPGSLVVHFIDVDQGDSTLIQAEGVTILIDAGRHDRNDVVPYLRSVGVTSIDLLVGTHPHADHIGQFPQVLRAFPVKEVWLSGDETTTRIFENTLDAILASKAGYHEPRAGERHELGPLTIEVVHPDRVYGHLNNGSIGLRITYGDVVFLFTGDAEGDAERQMIARGHNLQADVLHVGHHGSNTSSTLPFLQAVRPKIAVYSAGRNNSYGHPHREVIDRLTQLKIPVYGTDVHGTILLETDGRSFWVKAGTDAPPLGAPVAPSGCRPGQVDVNSAPAQELVKIVQIGNALAQEVIKRRPYASLDDLIRVPGIGDARLRAIKDQGLACAGGL